MSKFFDNVNNVDDKKSIDCNFLIDPGLTYHNIQYANQLFAWKSGDFLSKTSNDNNEKNLELSAQSQQSNLLKQPESQNTNYPASVFVNPEDQTSDSTKLVEVF